MNRRSSPAKGPRGGVESLAAIATEKSPRGAAAAELLNDGWERFWFTPAAVESLRLVRFGLGVAAALYFVSHWADIAYWFGSEGMLSSEQLGRLSRIPEAAGVGRWHLTPLYWIESALGLRLVLAVGILASLLAAVGIGGRWAVALAWLTLISVATRCWMIVGLVEIPLALGLGCLLIAAEDRYAARKLGFGRAASDGAAAPGGEFSWTTGLARRLLEIHITALVAATALTQLASPSWWNGEGAIQLVLPIDGPALDLTTLGNSRLVAAAITHAIVWLPLAAVPLLWLSGGAAAPSSGTSAGPGVGTAGAHRIARWAAGLLIVHAVALGLLSGHLLYGLVNAVLLSLFLGPRGPRGPQDGEQG